MWRRAVNRKNIQSRTGYKKNKEKRIVKIIARSKIENFKVLQNFKKRSYKTKIYFLQTKHVAWILWLISFNFTYLKRVLHYWKINLKINCITAQRWNSQLKKNMVRCLKYTFAAEKFPESNLTVFPILVRNQDRRDLA